jgi:hypothetical protein
MYATISGTISKLQTTLKRFEFRQIAITKITLTIMKIDVDGKKSIHQLIGIMDIDNSRPLGCNL